MDFIAEIGNFRINHSLFRGIKSQIIMDIVVLFLYVQISFGAGKFQYLFPLIVNFKFRQFNCINLT